MPEVKEIIKKRPDSFDVKNVQKLCGSEEIKKIIKGYKITKQRWTLCKFEKLDKP